MRSIVAQISVVALLVIAFTHFTDWLNYRSPLNLIWMIGIPVVVTVLFNRDAGDRALLALPLLICSFVVIMLYAAAMGFGP